MFPVASGAGAAEQNVIHPIGLYHGTVDSLERFLRHMPKSDDLTLVVLKGHLLVEEEINETLVSRLREPKVLFAARLSFSQRLAVLKALSGSDKDQPFRFTAIEHLNTLRNQLAHNLEPRELEKRVKTFLAELEAPGKEKEFAKETLGRRLKRCIALLCGELSGWNKAVRALQISPKKDV